MAITRERKEELVGIYADILKGTDGFVVTENRGMTVAQVAELRRRLASTSGVYMITKNTLFRIALEQTGWAVPEKLLVSTTAVAFGNGNLPAVTKVLQGFAKDVPDRFALKGGVIANSIFGEKEIDAVANLPTLDEIRAQLAGLIVAPASQIAGLLNAANSQVVNVLQAYLDKHGEGAAA